MEQKTHIQNGNWDAVFETIYSQYYTGLCTYAHSFIPDADEAEEIVQGIILKMWEQKENLENIISLKSYLFRSVKNTCLNYIKHQKLEEKYREKAWVELKKIEADFIDPYHNTELEHHISEAIKELPERCREVFEMSRFEGKKNKEISDYFNISIKAVEANITRALSILRKKVGEYMQTEKPLVVLLIISICI